MKPQDFGGVIHVPPRVIEEIDCLPGFLAGLFQRLLEKRQIPLQIEVTPHCIGNALVDFLVIHALGLRTHTHSPDGMNLIHVAKSRRRSVHPDLFSQTVELGSPLRLSPLLEENAHFSLHRDLKRENLPACLAFSAAGFDELIGKRPAQLSPVVDGCLAMSARQLDGTSANEVRPGGKRKRSNLGG